MFLIAFSWDSDLFLLGLGVLQIFKDFWGFLQRKEEEKKKKKKRGKKGIKGKEVGLREKIFLKFKEDGKNKIKIGIR